MGESSILRPVMFVHGFGGYPETWVEDGFVDYLVNEGGLDRDLIHLFHYGYDEEGNYNNKGDITQIARRMCYGPAEDEDALNSQIVRLSEKSKAKGGPEKVDIIAHSMGGIISRYYLKQNKAGEWDAEFGCRVRRLIEIGSPNLGLDALRLVRLVQENEFIAKLLNWLEKLPFLRGEPSQQLRELETAFHQMQVRAKDDFFGAEAPGAWPLASPALQQLAEDSPFMQELNRPESIPTDVEYYCLYGDIRVGLTVHLWGIPIYRREVTLGDLIIPPDSASTIPYVNPPSYPFPYSRQLVISIGGDAPPVTIQAQALVDLLPPSYHGHLRRHPEVQQQALDILRG